MPKYATPPERCTDLPTDALLLGVDGEHYHHYLSPYRQTVYIYTDGTRDRTVNVRGRSLSTYRSWVSQTRGQWAKWHCLEHGLSDLIDQLAAEITCAQPGD